MLTLLTLARQLKVCSRAELARRSRLSPPTVSSLVDRMLEAGILREDGFGESSGGRRPTLLRFNSSFGHVVGVDIGGTLVRFALADLNGEFLGQLEEPTKKTSPGPDPVIDQVVDGIRTLLKGSSVQISDVKAVAIGAPGITDCERGVVLHAPNLPGWRNVPVKELVERSLKVPVHVDNDVNMAVLGERWRGAAHGMKDVVFIAIGAGIGAGIILNGELYRGSSYAAGEVGYMLLEPSAARQEFPELGFLEMRASGPAIAARASSLMRRKVEAEFVFQAARSGDERAKILVEEMVSYLGAAVANIATVLDPEIVVLGGRVSLAGDMLIEPIRAVVERTVPSKPAIVVSALKDKAQLYGAVFSALEKADEQLADLIFQL